MEHFRNLLQARRVDRDEAGASAVEYGLLVAGIAALIVAVVFLFGGMIKDTFSTTCNTISAGQADAGNGDVGDCNE
jgi:pilus assembly protein Flp/PilA